MIESADRSIDTHWRQLHFLSQFGRYAWNCVRKMRKSQFLAHCFWFQFTVCMSCFLHVTNVAKLIQFFISPCDSAKHSLFLQFHRTPVFCSQTALSENLKQGKILDKQRQREVFLFSKRKNEIQFVVNVLFPEVFVLRCNVSCSRFWERFLIVEYKRNLNAGSEFYSRPSINF